MANKTLFKSLIGKLMPATDALNEEGAPAYALSAKHQLAQYAATGCLNTIFYASADDQLAKVLELCAEIDAEFIAKTAVFCRERGFMKDAGAALCCPVGEGPGCESGRSFVCNQARSCGSFPRQ